MKPDVKQRAEDMGTTLSDTQQAAIRAIANDLHRLNSSVIAAVEQGLSVELSRTARHHCGTGNWGDLMVPVIVRSI
jgi:hypothetical protein